MKRERETLTGRIEVEVKLTHTYTLNTYKQTDTQITFILTEKRNSTRSDTEKTLNNSGKS